MSAAGPGTVTASALWSLRPSTVHAAPAQAQSDVVGTVRVPASCEHGLTVSAHQNERL